MFSSVIDVSKGSWLRENADIEFANGNFVSTSINLKNKSAGDGRWDKTKEKTFLRAFRARTFSRSQGQSRRFNDVRVTSALPLIADLRRKDRHVRKVPNSDVPTNSIDDRQRHQFGMKSARPTTPREN